jgi:hypothetical protein
VTTAHQTVLDEDGKPSAAIIPWDVSVEIQEALSGGNPSSEEIEAMREVERDSREGKPGAFESHADLKARLDIP